MLAASYSLLSEMVPFPDPITYYALLFSIRWLDFDLLQMYAYCWLYVVDNRSVGQICSFASPALWQDIHVWNVFSTHEVLASPRSMAIQKLGQNNLVTKATMNGGSKCGAWLGSRARLTVAEESLHQSVYMLRAPLINVEDWSRCVCVSVWSYDEDGLIMWQPFYIPLALALLHVCPC